MKWSIRYGVLSALIVALITAVLVRDDSAETADAPPGAAVSGPALPLPSPSSNAGEAHHLSRDPGPAVRDPLPLHGTGSEELAALLEGQSASMALVDIFYEESEFADDGVAAFARYELHSGGEVAIALRQFTDTDQLAENREFKWLRSDVSFETDASYGRAISVAGALAFETFNRRSQKTGLRAVLGEELAVEIDASGVGPAAVKNMMEDIAFRYSTSMQIAGLRHGN